MPLLTIWSQLRLFWLHGCISSSARALHLCDQMAGEEANQLPVKRPAALREMLIQGLQHSRPLCANASRRGWHSRRGASRQKTGSFWKQMKRFGTSGQIPSGRQRSSWWRPDTGQSSATRAHAISAAWRSNPNTNSRGAGPRRAAADASHGTRR